MNREMVIAEDRPDAAESAEILARVRAGDPEVFCALAQSYERRLFQQAVALCQDVAAAEDLAAETLIEAWRSLPRFNGTCRFSTWLYAILVHRFQKAIRKARSRPLALSSLPWREAEEMELLLEKLTDAQPLPNDALQRKELDTGLQAAIRALPPKHQQVVLLRFYQGASLSEMAGALRLSVGTVKSRLHHALEKLRAMKSVMNLSNASGDT